MGFDLENLHLIWASIYMYVQMSLKWTLSFLVCIPSLHPHPRGDVGLKNGSSLSSVGRHRCVDHDLSVDLSHAVLERGYKQMPVGGREGEEPYGLAWLI